MVGGGCHNRGVGEVRPQGTTDATTVTSVGGGPHNPAVVASASHYEIRLHHETRIGCGWLGVKLDFVVGGGSHNRADVRSAP